MRSRVAGFATRVINLNARFERTVRRVAGEAGELSPTLQETRALAEINRLVAHVPGEVPIDPGRIGGGRPVTAPAELIEPDCGEATGIDDRCFTAARYMRRARAMAGFAPYSIFGRNDGLDLAS